MRISDHVYQIDVKPLGYKRQIAVYLIVGDDSSSMLVDTGPRCSVDILHSELKRIIDTRSLKYIALTHIHLDHGGGASLLAMKLEYNPLILVHPRGVKHIVNPSKLWESTKKVLGERIAELYGKPEPIDSTYVREVLDYEEIMLGSVKVKVIHTPGHAPHHVVYIVYPDNIAFTGDAVAIYYDGRIHPVSPPPFKTKQALQSIDKIIKEKPDKITVSHFGLADKPGLIVLEHAKQKIIEWRNFIKKKIEEDIRDPQVIYEELLKIDEETKYIVEIRENNPLFRGSAYKSVLGLFYDVLEEKQKRNKNKIIER